MRVAAGREVLLSDLPPELQPKEADITNLEADSWQKLLRSWGERQLQAGSTGIMVSAIQDLEKVMIDTALSHTGGRKRHAADLLGWGRNTLTRKLQEYSKADLESP